MHVAIISEAYNQEGRYLDGGLANTQQCLASLFPGAALFEVARPRVISGFRQAWRIARGFEDFNLRGFNLVISLGSGFAHGVITDTNARHITYCLTRPELARRSGIASHWYRFWDGAALARADVCIASTEYVRMSISKLCGSAVQVLYPPFSESELPGVQGRQSDGVLLVWRQRNARHRNACVQACNKLEVPLVVRVAADILKEDPGVLIYDGDESFPVEVARGRVLIAHRQNPAAEFARGEASGVIFDDWHPGVVADGIRRALEKKERSSPTPSDMISTPEAFSRAFIAIVEQTVRS